MEKPKFYSLEATVLSHGWVNLLPFNWNGKSLSANIKIDEHIHGLVITESDNKICVNLDSRNIPNEELTKIFNKIKYSLNFNFPLYETIPILKKNKKQKLIELVKRGWGRVLRGFSPWEDAVKTLLTTNCTWDRTKKMVQDICRINLSKSHDIKCTFPDPNSLLKKPSSLNDLKLGYRLHYLYELCQSVKRSEDYLSIYQKESGCNANEAYKAITSLKGFGDYASKHLLVLLGWHKYLPIDREVLKYLNVNSTISGKIPKNIDHYREYGDYRFTVYKLERIYAKMNWIGS